MATATLAGPPYPDGVWVCAWCKTHVDNEDDQHHCGVCMIRVCDSCAQADNDRMLQECRGCGGNLCMACLIATTPWYASIVDDDGLLGHYCSKDCVPID